MSFTTSERKQIVKDQLKLIVFGIGFVVPAIGVGFVSHSTFSWLGYVYIIGVIWSAILVWMQKSTLHHVQDIKELREKGLIPRRVNLMLIGMGSLTVLFLTLRNISVLVKVLAYPITKKLGSILSDDGVSRPSDSASMSGPEIIPDAANDSSLRGPTQPEKDWKDSLS